jgi:hypothetical protein
MTRPLQSDDSFPIVARNQQDLKLVNCLLHDLSLDLPDYDQVLYGVARFTLTDQDMIVKRDWVSEFRLSVFGVVTYEREEDSKNIPAPVTFNTMKYNAKTNVLVILCGEGVRLKMRVNGLHVELEHVA